MTGTMMRMMSPISPGFNLEIVPMPRQGSNVKSSEALMSRKESMKRSQMRGQLNQHLVKQKAIEK